MEETFPERGGEIFMVHIFFYLEFVFYYLEEVMDHKILTPPPTLGVSMKL